MEIIQINNMNTLRNYFRRSTQWKGKKILFTSKTTERFDSFNAHLNNSYVGNIIHGRKNSPSRDSLIKICLAIGATEEELKYLLLYSGLAPLYARRKRDVIIWFGIVKKEKIETVNDNLIERGMKPLYNEV